MNELDPGAFDNKERDPATALEITRLKKSGGALTKRIELVDGKPKSDGSQCRMSDGTMSRCPLPDLNAFAHLIETLPREEAIALGVMRPDLPNSMPMKAEAYAREGDGTRTRSMINYTAAQPALVLLDHDMKGMPPSVRDRLDSAGGFLGALATLIPGLDALGYVARDSTSAGLFNSETQENYPGNGGQHIYLLVKDGGDIDRFLKTLHDVAWANGYGWHLAGAAGQALERSIVDVAVRFG
jgi:hypothetical protein